jgi:hypothetical protein
LRFIGAQRLFAMDNLSGFQHSSGMTLILMGDWCSEGWHRNLKKLRQHVEKIDGGIRAMKWNRAKKTNSLPGDIFFS